MTRKKRKDREAKETIEIRKSKNLQMLFAEWTIMARLSEKGWREDRLRLENKNVKNSG